MKQRRRTSAKIMIGVLNVPLNVWSFIIESINDAIKFYAQYYTQHNIT